MAHGRPQHLSRRCSVYGVCGGAGRAELEFTQRVTMEVALHARPRVILGCCGVLSNKSDWHLGEVESSHGL